MGIHSPVAQRKRPAPQTTEVAKIPAGNQGMDGRVALADGNMNTPIYTFNLMASEFGMKVRNGYREHCVTLVDVLSTGVSTMMPFEATGDPTANRLFAVTNEGIWDVTVFNTPVLLVTFSIQNEDAGVGTFVQYITDAGDSLLFYADGENGLHQYTQATGLWTVPAGITGVDVTLVRFIMIHKLRIWMIEKDESDAWYLPISSIAGLAVKFNFGTQLKHGGSLAGLYNWTIDGGIGVDDYLVAVSSSGDVLPYQGADPEAVDDWQLRGAYYIGDVADNRRCASVFGGDLLLLSTFGLTAMQDLLAGSGVAELASKDTLGARIAFLIQEDIRNYDIDTGWGLGFAPSSGDVIIFSPVRDNGVYLQYVYDMANSSLGLWRDVPMLDFAEYQGVVFAGTEDSRVIAMDTDIDEVKITPINDQNGVEIKFSSLFSFNSYDTSGRFKRGVMIRPDFLSHNKINYEAKFAFDYEILTFTNTLSGATDPAGRWDIGEWDTAIWGSSVSVNRAQPLGGSGMGRTMAVAVNGSGTSNSWLMSYDVMWNSGGML